MKEHFEDVFNRPVPGNAQDVMHSFRPPKHEEVTIATKAMKTGKAGGLHV